MSPLARQGHAGDPHAAGRMGPLAERRALERGESPAAPASRRRPDHRRAGRAGGPDPRGRMSSARPAGTKMIASSARRSHELSSPVPTYR